MIRIVFHFSIRVYWKDAPKDSKNRHLPKQDNRRFGDEAEAEINAMTCRRGKSTVDNYHTALRSFLCYAGEDILVTDIRKETAEGWHHAEHHLLLHALTAGDCEQGVRRGGEQAGLQHGLHR